MSVSDPAATSTTAATKTSTKTGTAARPTLIASALQASSLDEQQLGGKAAQMAWLTRHGFPVPEWLVLTTDAFDAFVAGHGLQDWLNQQTQALTTAAQAGEIAVRIHQRVCSLPLPENLHQVLLAQLPQLAQANQDVSKQPFAVRSSVVGEDSDAASFAGQMDSFLFQHGLAAIEDAIRRVWASAFSERALAYRLRHGISLQDIRCAVIVQRMIEGQVSGVMFTAHPVTGRRDHLLVSACWGCGEGLVSGLCSADEFTLDQQGERVQQQLADKDRALRFNRQLGQGTEEVMIPEAERLQACLTVEQTRQLARTGLRVAQLRHCPQDIEWTFSEDRLWLLQTRPVTALPRPAQPRGRRIVWDNSNIQESYCGITTPLTFSFARRAYATVYEQTMAILGLPKSTIAAQRDMLDNMLGLIRGRVFYNINNWYRGLQFLPGFKSNKAAMERMMGLQDPVDFIEDRALSPAEKLRKLPSMLRALFNLLLSFATMEKRVADFRALFEREYQAVPRKHLHTLEMAELMDWVKRLDRNILQGWTAPILNDFFVMMSNARVHAALHKAGVEGQDAVQNNLMSGEEGIESTEPTKFLLRMAAAVRREPSLRELIRNTPNAKLMDALQQPWPTFYILCQEYIERYGDRTMGELKLESITLRQDTAFLFAILKNFIDRDDLSLEHLNRNEMTLRQQAETNAFTAIARSAGQRGLRRFRKHLQRLRSAVKHRENMRLARTRLFGLYRDLFLEMGKRLYEADCLDAARDVFYLTLDELHAWVDGTSVGSLRGVANVRKAEYAAYAPDDELPHHFFTWGAVYHYNACEYPYQIPVVQAGDALQGIGCYPGIVEQPVRLIFSPQDELSLDGQILCTMRTDPGWAPLFPSAGGLLIERGSTLSHSAVVARELGIPAVVNVPGITKILRNGEKIRIDGSSGLVVRLEADAEAAPADADRLAATP